MADAIIVSIDLHKLMDHFANCRKPMSFEAVETWLREMGFNRTDDGWIVEKISLTSRDRTEYRIMRRL